jgi:glycosyltransferase involved in cell wall biosynthesis
MDATQTIVVVAHGHPELSPGGAEIVAYRLFDGLRRRNGVRAFFLAGADDPIQIAPDGLRAYHGRDDEFLFPATTTDNFEFSQKSQKTIESFIRFLERTRPDIIHFHHYFNVGLEFLRAARQVLPRVKLVLTLHEYHAICAHWGLMVKTGSAALCHSASPNDCATCFPARSAAAFAQRRDFIRAHFEYIDMFIGPSAFLRDRYIAWGVPPMRITMIENGTAMVDAPPPRSLGRGERRSVFGFFGQINPFKGLSQLLAAFAAFDRSEDIRLMIHGAYLEFNDPRFVDEIRELLARTTDRTLFVGPYEYADLTRLMGGIDWVVMPSIWWENAPLVIEEALAHRRPVICSDIGGMAEKVRPGLDGLHFPAGDQGALAATLLRAVSDRDLWDQLRQTMRSPSDAARFVDDHLRLYDHIAAPGGAFNVRARTSSKEAAIDAPKTQSMTGSTQIVPLGHGLFRLDIARTGSPLEQATEPAIHVCAAPDGGSNSVTFTRDGAVGREVWLGSEGGVIFAASRNNKSRLLVISYDTVPRVATSRIADPPM